MFLIILNVLLSYQIIMCYYNVFVMIFNNSMPFNNTCCVCSLNIETSNKNQSLNKFYKTINVKIRKNCVDIN